MKSSFYRIKWLFSRISFLNSKGLCLFMLTGMLMTSCLATKSVSNKNQTALPENNQSATGKMKVLTDIDRNTMELLYDPADSLLNLAVKKSDWLPICIGVLGINFNLRPTSSVLEMNGIEIPLTDIQQITARSPSPIVILPEQTGRLALVQGDFTGSTIYQAKIIAVFSDTPTQLLFHFLQKNCSNISPLLDPK